MRAIITRGKNANVIIGSVLMDGFSQICITFNDKYGKTVVKTYNKGKCHSIRFIP